MKEVSEYLPAAQTVEPSAVSSKMSMSAHSVDAPTPNPMMSSPLDLPIKQFRDGLARRKANRSALVEWIRESLVEGVDFGSVPTKRGPSKPSLWKPGAEKICGMLGVIVHYPAFKDYERMALEGRALEHIIIRCELHDANGHVVAGGVGARSVKQDHGDLNKALKMAAKSAHIDAALRMAGLSELFSQDLEDQAYGQEEGSYRGPRITPGEIKILEQEIQRHQLDIERVRSWLVRATSGRVSRFEDITPELQSMLLKKLPEWSNKPK